MQDSVNVTQADARRFWSKVDVRGPDDCWEWRGDRQARGYGRFCFKKKRLTASRVSFALANGQWPEPALQVCHKCDNPPCVNPAHLYAGTRSDNMKDAVERGRWRNQHLGKTHCKRGHEYTEANTFWQGAEKNRRWCRKCRAEHERAKRIKLKTKLGAA